MSGCAFGGIEKTVAEVGKIEMNIRQVFARGAAGKFLDRINKINRILENGSNILNPVNPVNPV